MIKRLGAKNWTRLHRLVYPAALLAAAHFIFAVKSWPLEPLLYAGGAVGLLLVRLAPRRRPSLEQAHKA
jgi:sulfoxide reductase heme-binding subunit YedZ